MDTSGPPDDRRPTDPLAADRARTLLTITNAVVPHLTRDALFPAITSALREVVEFDRRTIFLYDDQKNVLRMVSTENGAPTDAFAPGMELGLDSSRAGWAFVHQRPFYNSDLEKERTSPGEEMLYREGFRSLIVVPLIVRGTSIGTLNLGSAQPMRYGAAEAELLQDVASQLAIAIANMREYEEIRRVNAQLERENLYLRDMLDAGRDVQLSPTPGPPTPAASDRAQPTASATAAPLAMGSGTLEDVERAHILAVLAQTGWVIEGPRGAAKILDMHPNTLRSRMKKLGLERSRHGTPLPPPVEGV
jgi:transcriptional regulator with GAF, ATPase, and Fis domain